MRLGAASMLRPALAVATDLQLSVAPAAAGASPRPRRSRRAEHVQLPGVSGHQVSKRASKTSGGTATSADRGRHRPPLADAL